MPATVPHPASFINPHSLAWSAEITKYDAYIFVTAEHNYGLAGRIKNAADYLCEEWIGKPAWVVSYGIHGAEIAKRNLRETLGRMKLWVVGRGDAVEVWGEGRGETWKAIRGTLWEKTLGLWEEMMRGQVLGGFEELVGDERGGCEGCWVLDLGSCDWVHAERDIL